MASPAIQPVAPASPGATGTWRRQLRSVALVGSSALVVASLAAGIVAVVAGAGWPDAAATAASIALLVAGTAALWLVGRIVTTDDPDVELPGGVTLLVVGTAGPSATGATSVSRMWALGTDVSDLARALVLGVASPPSALDAAVLTWAGSLGLDPAAIAAELPRVDEVPYDADRRRLTTVHDTGDGYLVVCRAAPETIWPLLITARNGCCAAREQGRPVARAWAAQGLRVLAVATTTRQVVGNSAGRLESGLRLQGLVAFDDAVPPVSREDVASLADLGVEVALVSADPRASALATATRIGLVVGTRGSGLVTGDDVSAGSWPEDVRVFAAVPPQQRAQLVAHWQATGQVVAAADGADLPAVGEDPAELISRIRASRHARDVIRRGGGVIAVSVLVMLALLVAGASAGGAPWLTPGQVVWPVAIAVAAALAYRREPPDAAAAISPRGHRRLFTGSWWRSVVTVSLVVLGWATVAGWLAPSGPASVTWVTVIAAVIGVAAGTRSRPVTAAGGRIWVDGVLAAAAVCTVLLARPTWGEALVGAAAVALGYGASRLVRIG